MHRPSTLELRWRDRYVRSAIQGPRDAARTRQTATTWRQEPRNSATCVDDEHSALPIAEGGPTFLLMMSKPGAAAVLSFVVPGVGQVYNGDFLRGAFWLIVTPGFWVGTGGMLGWACHLTSAYTAYKRAARREELAVAL